VFVSLLLSADACFLLLICIVQPSYVLLKTAVKNCQLVSPESQREHPELKGVQGMSVLSTYEETYVLEYILYEISVGKVYD
jgi:hypothetical protein